MHSNASCQSARRTEVRAKGILWSGPAAMPLQDAPLSRSRVALQVQRASAFDRSLS